MITFIVCTTFLYMKLSELIIYYSCIVGMNLVKQMDRLCMNEFASDPLPLDLNKQNGSNMQIRLCKSEL